MPDFLETIKERPLVTYGAVGSLLAGRGFDMTGCLGKWLLDNPDQLDWFTRQYLEAGCHILASAGSQCGPWKLKPWGLEDRVIELNRKVTERVKAAKDFSKLPVMAAMAFDNTPKGPRTIMGVDPKTAAIRLSEAGADVVGHNCGGADPGSVTRILDEMRQVIDKPLVAKPNAGTPVLVDGKTHWPETPEAFAAAASMWVKTGARVVGGCCGSTPAHAAAISQALKDM